MLIVEIAAGIVLAAIVLANLDSIAAVLGAIILGVPLLALVGFLFLGMGWWAILVIAAIVGFFVMTNHPALDSRPEVRAAWKKRRQASVAAAAPSRLGALIVVLTGLLAIIASIIALGLINNLNPGAIAAVPLAALGWIAAARLHRRVFRREKLEMVFMARAAARETAAPKPPN